MPPIKRRHFLQSAGSMLGAIALSQADFLQQANRVGRLLAQETPRKLALLVGINNYPNSAALYGCLNDVELQKLLLIHRFGFKPTDILEVSDNSDLKPTRANILHAFQAHLIEQAKPGDVVVFHYSGHGALVQDPDPIRGQDANGADVTYETNGTLVPQDLGALISTASEVVVPDIMGRTLFLLMHAIQTEQLTVVLDSCHSGGGTRGNVKVRALSRARLRSGEQYVASPEEFELQRQLLGNLSMAEFQKRRQRGIAKGVAIGSALRDQLAIDDNPFGNYYAGAFTYLLTRYLWQASGEQSAEAAANALLLSTRSRAEDKHGIQVPDFYYMPDSNKQQPIYFVGDRSFRSAEAAITSMSGDQVQFWLGGVSSRSLSSGSTAGAIFTVLDAQGQPVGEIEQTSRTDLYGQGKLISGQSGTVEIGQILRERVRNLPADLTLNIGLDGSLGADLEAARTALEAVERVQIFAPGAPGAEYLLGRFTATAQQQAIADGLTDLPPLNSIGLFTRRNRPLDTDYFTPVNDTVSRAVSRLIPQFKALLARKILGLVQTGDTTALPVTAKILAIAANTQTSQVVAEVSSRGAREAGLVGDRLQTTPQFPSGSTLKVEITNGDDRDLYISILVVAADGTIIPLYPNNFIDAEERVRVPRKGSLVLPQDRDGVDFVVGGSSGFPEILVLTSTEPLYDALKAMETIARNRNLSRGEILSLRGDESTDVLDLLLGDLTKLTRSMRGVADGTIGVQSRTTQVDTSAIAILSATIEVVPNEGL